MAKYFDAHVTGVCSTKNLKLIESLGADEVIDYTSTNFCAEGKKYDILFDTVGKSSFRQAKHVLSDDGLYMSPVLSFRLLLESLRTSRTSGRRARFSATGMRTKIELRTFFQQLLEIHQSKGLKIIIDKRFRLDNIAMAYHYVSTGKKVGNVVIVNE